MRFMLPVVLVLCSRLHSRLCLLVPSPSKVTSLTEFSLIMRLQKYLNSKWGPYQFRAKILTPDGTFGKNTTKALQVYLNQFSLGDERALEVDGTQGALLVRALQEYLVKKGAKPEKTVLGVPLYGRAFLLKNSHDDRMGAPAQANSFAGKNIASFP